MASRAGEKTGARIRIWDRPVRIFHWSVAVLIGMAWWTAEHDQMQLHLVIGYLVAALVLFRIWWGFVGGSTARFSSFVKGPCAVARYAVNLGRGEASRFVPGHNPMGGWSVVGLLAAMAAEVALGLFSVDVDGEASGPLGDRVSFDTGRLAAHWHHLLFNGLLVLVALHLLAVGFYLIIKRDNLVGPMLTGFKRGPKHEEGLKGAPAWLAWLGAAIAAGLALALSRGLR